MNDGVAMHDNLNSTDELMKVNMGTAQKGEVFEAVKAKYVEHFANAEKAEEQKQGICMQIQQVGPQLNALLGQMGNDPAKSAFFQ